MSDGRDVFPAGEVMSGSREGGPDQGRATGTDGGYDRRARYLAKAASLGHVVTDEDSIEQVDLDH
jgi:hypothetical protein